MVSDQVSVFAEYRYTAYSPTVFNTSGNPEAQTEHNNGIRTGLNFHFWSP